MSGLCERLVQAASSTKDITISNLLFEARRRISELEASQKPPKDTWEEAYEIQANQIIKLNREKSELEARIKTVKNIRQRGDFMATKDVLAALEAG
jgi:hypothetical protein